MLVVSQGGRYMLESHPQQQLCIVLACDHRLAILEVVTGERHQLGQRPKLGTDCRASRRIGAGRAAAARVGTGSRRRGPVLG